MTYRVHGKFATKTEYDQFMQTGKAPAAKAKVATPAAQPLQPTVVQSQSFTSPPLKVTTNQGVGGASKNMHKAQRLINHVALVLDGSGSMKKHQANVVKVADEQIRHLMVRSEELCQETRVSVYVFDDVVDCLIFDMDVMRLPSIEDLYTIDGWTALIDSVVKSQEDLATTSQIYGDHAFLTFVLTDGEENASKNKMTSLSKFTTNAPENWTVGFLVPDKQGIAYLSRCGVPSECIMVWDAKDANGMLDVGRVVRQATDTYMTARASGVRGTRSLFAVIPTGIDAVNKKTVAATLTPMSVDKYSLHEVGKEVARIDEFVTNVVGKYYIPGKSYYQFMKPETIQGGKSIIVVDKKTNQAYEGKDARGLIGLTWGVEAKAKPEDNPEYDIYIQSTALNRNLIPGTKLLLLK